MNGRYTSPRGGQTIAEWTGFLVLALFLAFGWSEVGAQTSAAQPAAKVARIGYVDVIPREIGAIRLHNLAKRLGELGYVEGKNLFIEARWAEGNRDRLPALVAELISAHVDVIVAGTGQSAMAAKRLTSTVPIVMTSSADAVPQGIVDSLARPGGNVTGLTSLSAELAPKRLQLLKELLPRLRGITALVCSTSLINRIELGHVQAAAATMGVEVQSIDISSTTNSWQGASQALSRSHPDALFLTDCPTLPFQAIADFALQQRIPSMAPYPAGAPLGGLISYGPDDADLSRRAATYVDKILRGAKPGDLPVEQPIAFELAIDLRTAKALGITVPKDLLLRATRLLE